MAGQGAGPSRRSHTKSRKGCKTCKRRHIRCDENFPQCRNCTKHHVRCDYMESMGSDTESQHSPEQHTVVLSPNSEDRVESWQQTGAYPYPDLHVYPSPQAQEYSRNELRLIHHLSSISNDLLLRGTTNLTIWTQKMPKFLSLASSYPFVMHALLSFSANHLARTQGSTETRNLQIQHGGIALGGLHEAIGSFSRENADAVLAASLLMLWQAMDWRSWSSLRAGIQTVLSAMQSWKHDSIFAEYVAQEDHVASSLRSHHRQRSVDQAERGAILQNTANALQGLQVTLAGHEQETYWTGQLLSYIQGLQSMEPPQSLEDQFNQLYHLRKWLFWVPTTLLQQQGVQGPAMLTLAYFYSTALALEPLYPDLGPSFCAAMALSPLEAIINVTDTMQSTHPMDASILELTSLMQHPKQTAFSYRGQTLPAHQPSLQSTPLDISPEPLSYTNMNNLSPAFAPSPLHYGTPQSATTASSQQSPFLEVPTMNPASGFGLGTQTWGAAPSPGFPPQGYGSEAAMFGYNHPSMGGGSGFRGGFVPSPLAPVWT